ncbi:hypothetical protein DFH08DRAFT_802322 [Mycena albidolilacea]|uniref:Uncharacterized protein n=1 Tax=Mycena albidolilacea TaxID=1033008 RepID=A0AAD7AH41_9AGAR|nr:hypothetical protein DFH08DRAFT_802322 [Mycena albidolilacea]
MLMCLLCTFPSLPTLRLFLSLAALLTVFHVAGGLKDKGWTYTMEGRFLEIVLALLAQARGRCRDTHRPLIALALSVYAAHPRRAGRREWGGGCTELEADIFVAKFVEQELKDAHGVAPARVAICGHGHGTRRQGRRGVRHVGEWNMDDDEGEGNSDNDCVEDDL